jgi:spermidine synthase
LNRKFIDIVPFYPDFLQSENYSIYKQKLNSIDNISEFALKYINHISLEKDYLILFNKNIEKVMMSNHESETISNQKFLNNANGDILIFGLGIGLIIFPLLNDDSIKSITIVEIDSGLIDLVEPIVKKYDIKNKLSVINCDAFDYYKICKSKYDTIYFDIWAIIDNFAFSEMKLLKNNYRPFLKENGWIDSWRSEEISNY